MTHGENERLRIEKCVRQVARFWQTKDGTPDEFARFCRENYISDPVLLQQTADRYESTLAGVYGHFAEMSRYHLSWNLTVDTGPLLPIDYVFARYSPSAHLAEDMFKSKIAFIALLNYPQYSLEELLADGPTWTRDKWAQARLADNFTARIPADISQQNSDAYVAASTYISDYNIFMHHLQTTDGRRLFPEGMRLVTHWNLRDELKSQYAEPDGLERQEMIYNLMNKIISQEIPEAVINNPAVDWNMTTNGVTNSPIDDGPPRKEWESAGQPGDAVDNTREQDDRYRHLLNGFYAQQRVDDFYPDLPTLMDRRFKRGREMLEEEVEKILKSVVGAEVNKKIGRLIEKRLGRKLRPFDIWYDGFKARSGIGQEKLDSIVGAKYPTVEAFQADFPRLLQRLGFDETTAAFLHSRIQIDPSRGIGHASGPGRKADKARLRTRVGETGMNYKGYNIAIHEFGHNVEQVLSLNKVDHTLLRGVPNTAFTEAFAFVFQSRDLELLGLKNDNPQADELKLLDDFWGVYEISGVALVDMKVWNWMYAHPEATPEELKVAVIDIAKNIWNEYFSPVFGVRDIELLAIYSHMISSRLYLPDYPIGSIIEFQIEDYLKTGNLAEEMERMCVMGSVTPDLWMKNAVGGPISTAPFIQAVEKAVQVLDK
ncbi:MAG: hypothetical protein GY841_02145 [FCB group bacterium]|nr:hypothetical protein [FCB group bacterium]